MGDNGYFYVSYYDESFAKPGVEGIAYTFILNETMKYDKNYQYDIAGKTDYLHDDRTAVWYKNKFTAEGNEILSGVSTYFEKFTNWTVSVYVNNVLKTTKSGSSQAGYYTFHLDDIVPLYKGDVFEIVFNTTSDRLSGVPISEIVALNKAIYYPEISYVSYDGINWQDLFYLSKTYALHTYKSQVACIKAFTVLADYNTTTTISVANGSIEISVEDQFGNPVKAGEVSVNLSGNVQTFKLNDGKVVVPINLLDGIYDIDATYSGENYNSSRGSCALEIILNVDLTSDNVYTYNSNCRIILSDQFGNPISGKVMILNLNNEQYNLTSDGHGVMTFNLRLNIGKYGLTLINPFNNDNITKTIQIAPRLSGNQNIVMYYGSNKVFKVRIHDDNGNILEGESIKIRIGGKSYTAKSDKNGFATVKLNKLVAKTYSVTVDYKGFKISNKIKIRPTLTAKNKSIKKGKVLKFTAKLVNSKGKALKGKKITFKIKNKKYSAKTNRKGIATIKIKKLKAGKYTIMTSFKNNKIKNKITVRK